ncbi:MAG TPA: hypothetical protein VMS96_02355 [Terriglobales bacterium]|nr:hypothetical protein [Terriglobales bacterium]
MKDDISLQMVKILRSQRDRINCLEDSVQALKMVISRMSGADAREAFAGFAGLEHQFREARTGHQERDQLDALIELADRGKTTDEIDA